MSDLAPQPPAAPSLHKSVAQVKGAAPQPAQPTTPQIPTTVVPQAANPPAPAAPTDPQQPLQLQPTGSPFITQPLSQPQSQTPQQTTQAPPATPVQQAATLQPAAQAPTPAPASSPLIDKFSKLGFSIPEGMDDDAFAEAVAAKIDSANEIHDQFTPHRDQFLEWQKAQQASQSSESGNALPAQPAPGMTSAVSPEPPSAGAQPKLSSEAEVLAKQGLITKGENGWTSSNPVFQQFADEYNRVEAYRQAMALRLIDDPAGFIQEHLPRQGESEAITALQEQIKQLEERYETQFNSNADAEVDSWIEHNKTALFANGIDGALTPLGQSYEAFAGQITNMAEQMGRSLSRKELHDQTQAMMQAAGLFVQPQAQQPAPVAQPQYPQVTQQADPAPQQTFMQQAAQTPPRMPVNRLTEQGHPAQQPNGLQHIPRARGGKPSLHGIINAQKNGQLTG